MKPGTIPFEPMSEANENYRIDRVYSINVTLFQECTLY